MKIDNFATYLVLSSNEHNATCIEIDFDEDTMGLSGDLVDIDISWHIMNTQKFTIRMAGKPITLVVG